MKILKLKKEEKDFYLLRSYIMEEKNYTSLITLNKGIEFLKSVFGNDSNIKITDGLRGDRNSVGFTCYISSGRENWLLKQCYVGFWPFHCEIVLGDFGEPKTDHRIYKKRYAKFIYHLIKEQNKKGNTDFSCEEFEKDYIAYLDEIRKKEINKVEKEYYNNLL